MIIKSLKNINDLIFNLYKKNKIIILGLLIILIIILCLRFYSNKEGLCMQGCQRPKQILTDTSQPDYLKNGIPLSNCKILSISKLIFLSWQAFLTMSEFSRINLISNIRLF